MIYDLRFKNKVAKVGKLIKVLLKNRGIKTKREVEDFLDPKLTDVTTAAVGIDRANLKRAIKRIKLAIEKKEEIVVFGDYDVDGICGTAILWEALNSLGAKVTPYIPHRIEEGYGLSIRGIDNLKFKISNLKLIITVDNGIVANKAVDFANKQGIDVIITDHHVPAKNLPKAFAIVHTTKLCGTGVAWLLSQEILNSKSQIPNKSKKINSNFQKENDHLALVALATVADMVPLKEANRTLLIFGLLALRQTKRVGLSELFKEAGIDKTKIGVYEIGHIIAPRLNATGRLDYAMDSLRLICTTNQKRAEKLSKEIGLTNKERQLLTIETTEHAITKIKNQKSKIKNLLFISHENYEQGIIGLVAGKLVEEFYRPAIVISKGEKFSKASARSIHGFNIIEFIRTASEFLVDVGGHPMAAGFTVETTKLLKLQKELEDKAESVLSKDLLTRSLKIDCELPLPFINLNLYESLQALSPFGMGSPEPTFISKNVVVEDMRLVGVEGKHLKLKLKVNSATQSEKLKVIGGIGFGMGEKANDFKIGDKVDVVYTIDENIWNGNRELQLKIKDLRSAV